MASSKAPTVEMSARDFANLVRPVMRLADTGQTLPILNAVRFHSHKGYLIATATDRYVIGFHRAQASAPDGIEAVISLHSLSHILTVFKATRHANPDLTIAFDNGRVIVSVPTLGETLSGELSWPLMEGEYPKVGSILESTSGTEGSTTGINPTFLARFAGIGDRAEPMVLTVRENGLNLVRVGENFIGAIMSTRFSDDGEGVPSREAWAEFTSPAPKPATAKPKTRRTSKKVQAEPADRAAS